MTDKQKQSIISYFTKPIPFADVIKILFGFYLAVFKFGGWEQKEAANYYKMQNSVELINGKLVQLGSDKVVGKSDVDMSTQRVLDTIRVNQNQNIAYFNKILK